MSIKWCKTFYYYEKLINRCKEKDKVVIYRLGELRDMP